MKTELDKEEVPWQTLVSICEKCGKKLDSKGENPSQSLRGWLKDEIKSRGLKGKVRAVTSTCLDVCPDDRIAISITGVNPPECVVIDPKKDRDHLLDRISSR